MAGAVPEELHLCLVEDHCDAAHFLAACFRAKLIGSAGAELVHVDAHPDLSAPSVPTSTADLRRPGGLAAALDSDGGIAEFILPLVHLGVLSRVVWVRSPWSRQFNDGRYSFLAGDRSDSPDFAPRMGVSLRHAYYFDDDAVVEETSLSNVRRVDLRVTAAAETPLPPSEAPWVLDICLDYLSTHNPFLEELLRLMEGSESAAGAVLEVLEAMRHSDIADALSVPDMRDLRRRAEEVFRRLLGSPDSPPQDDDAALLAGGDSSLLARFLAAAKGIGRAAREYAVSVGQLLLLPHRPNSEVEVRSLLSSLMQFLKASRPRPPVAIVVARSAADGFIVDADRCQELVLDAINEELLPVWSGSAGRVLRIALHDLCEDAESRCAALLLRSARSDPTYRLKRKALEESGIIAAASDD